jgi:hypothetical protein
MSKMVEKGILGRKVGKGFYLYPKDAKKGSKEKALNPEVRYTSSIYSTTSSSYFSSSLSYYNYFHLHVLILSINAAFFRTIHSVTLYILLSFSLYYTA